MGYLDYSGLGHFLDKLKTIFVLLSQKGAANGVAGLDSNGKVPISQLPAIVDDVIEGYYYNGNFYEEAAHSTLITGVSDKIYISKDTDKMYRWENNTYIELANTDVMTGATSSVAGTKGLVPAPAAGKNVQYLKGDATWDSPSLSELGLSVNNGQIEVTFQVEEDDD